MAWHNESKRHSEAAKGHKTGRKDRTRRKLAFQSRPPSPKTLIVSKGDKRILTDEQGNRLASLKVKNDSDQSILIIDWKAKVKGHGYGRELIKRVVEESPNRYYIATDGLTEMGMANIQKAFPDYRIIERRIGLGTHGIAILMRQDAIDYYIDKNEENKSKDIHRISMFNFPKSWHSKHKPEVKPDVVA